MREETSTKPQANFVSAKKDHLEMLLRWVRKKGSFPRLLI